MKLLVFFNENKNQITFYYIPALKPIDDSKNEERKNSENSRPESRQSGVSNKSKNSKK